MMSNKGHVQGEKAKKSQEFPKPVHYDYKNLLGGMMRKFSWMLLVLLVLVGCGDKTRTPKDVEVIKTSEAIGAGALAMVYGQTSGTFVSGSRRFVAKVTVNLIEVAGTGGDREYSTPADDQGLYRLEGVTPGLYFFTVDDSAYQEFKSKPVVVSAGGCYGYDLQLIYLQSQAQIQVLMVIESAKVLKGAIENKIIWEKDGAEMVRIPEQVGKLFKDYYDRLGDLVSAPIGTITPVFYMDACEVTVGQFRKFLKSSSHVVDTDMSKVGIQHLDWEGIYEYSPTDKHPMLGVSHYDATAYAEWAGKRLPTEKEWEFAARGGLKGKVYSWGDNKNSAYARNYANFIGIDCKDKWGRTTAPVGSFKPNGYGLFDMGGNVWEWCQDWYSSERKDRVLRGGAVNNYTLEVAHRTHQGSLQADNWVYGHGFRCVADVK